jgi:DNA-binding response OmpR family regulator
MTTRGKALVVDWNYMVAETIGDVLAKWGYEALSETTFDGARRELDASPPLTLLVVHGGAPGNFEARAFIAYALAGFPSLPTVVISGLPRHETSLAPGSWAYVQKPFDTPELLRAIEMAKDLASENSIEGRLYKPWAFGVLTPNQQAIAQMRLGLDDL